MTTMEIQFLHMIYKKHITSTEKYEIMEWMAFCGK